MSTAYSRRVSFDSLNPNIQVEPDEPIHIPPQYLKNSIYKHSSTSTSTTTPNKRQLDLNFGYEPSSKHQDLYKVFDSFQEINNKGYRSNYVATRRKIPKLPPAPQKSILKKTIHENMIDETIPKSFNENDGANSFASVLPSQQRKKSLVEMTTEELIAMDQQYRRGGVNIDDFKFDGDNYLPFHNLSSIDSKKPKNNLPNIDKLVGNIVTVNNKKLLKSTSINYKSYSVSFRHRFMASYIDSVFEKYSQKESAIESDASDNNDDEERPESLRELIVYISGRRHTWDSINWVLKNFLIDGDHLIIISQLPILSCGENEDDELIDCDFIKSKTDALSSYIFKAIELLGKQNLKISITIEFIKDKSVKNLIKNSINLYNPNFFLISSLISNRLTVRFENNNVKLPYYLMKNLNLTTIIIPDLLIDKNYVSLDCLDQSTNVIPDIIEPEEESNGPADSYLEKLNKISDAYKVIELNQLKSESSISSSNPLSRSNSNSHSNSQSRNSNSRTTSNNEADSPTNYYPTKIKFSDNLSIPKYNNNGYSNSSSPYSSRRNSNNSSGIYKVKSLLDDSTSANHIQRSKSYNSTPVTNSLSNVSTNSERRNSSSTNHVVKKSKSVDEGVSGKKSGGFLAKLGFRKK